MKQSLNHQKLYIFSWAKLVQLIKKFLFSEMSVRRAYIGIVLGKINRIFRASSTGWIFQE